MTDNAITVVGNLARDPEMRYTAGGQARVTFGVAVNRRWMNKQTNDWEERVSFFNVVVWGEMAENVAGSLSKGSRAVVTGRLEQRSWETEQGEKRSVVEIVADEVGPSLRWATAEVNRTERRGPGEGGGGGQRPSVPDTGNGNSNGGVGGNAPTYENFGNEEPF